jgi:hypothetical protein
MVTARFGYQAIISHSNTVLLNRLGLGPQKPSIQSEIVRQIGIFEPRQFNNHLTKPIILKYCYNIRCLVRVFGIQGSKCAPTEDIIDAQIRKEIYKFIKQMIVTLKQCSNRACSVGGVFLVFKAQSVYLQSIQLECIKLYDSDLKNMLQQSMLCWWSILASQD